MARGEARRRSRRQNIDVERDQEPAGHHDRRHEGGKTRDLLHLLENMIVRTKKQRVLPELGVAFANEVGVER